MFHVSIVSQLNQVILCTNLFLHQNFVVFVSVLTTSSSILFALASWSDLTTYVPVVLCLWRPWLVEPTASNWIISRVGVTLANRSLPGWDELSISIIPYQRSTGDLTPKCGREGFVQIQAGPTAYFGFNYDRMANSDGKISSWQECSLLKRLHVCWVLNTEWGLFHQGNNMYDT